MPEVGIGFFPDVGAAYALARLPHRIGALLVATGMRIEADDVVELGIAQTFVAAERIAALAAALAEPGSLEAILDRFSTRSPPGRLIAQGEEIGAWFARLERPGDARRVGQGRRGAGNGRGGARGDAHDLAHQPGDRPAPDRARRQASLEETLRSISASPRASAAAADIYEGVRAAIVDKDRNPRWRPSADEPLDAAAIDAYFAPLPPSEELTFPEPRR